MAARAAERAEVLVGLDMERPLEDCEFVASASANSIRARLRERWHDTFQKDKFDGGDHSSRHPLIIRFLASTAVFWLAVTPDRHQQSRLDLCRRRPVEELCPFPLDLQPSRREIWLDADREVDDLGFQPGTYEVADIPSSNCVLVVRVKAKGNWPFSISIVSAEEAGSESDEFKLSPSDGDSWWASHMVFATFSQVRLDWSSNIQKLKMQFQLLPCHGMSNVKFTEAMPADMPDIGKPHRDVGFAEECCALCYATSNCEVWMFLHLQDDTGCWLLKEVKGFEHNDFGPVMGRIRGMLN